MRPSRGWISLAVLIGFAVCPHPSALGQTLEDYKRASESSGCGPIPYSSVRQDCESAVKEKETACAEKFACPQDLDKREKEEIARRIRNGEGCLAKREAIAAIFERARSSLRNESDAERRPYASKSADRIENEQPGHKSAIEQVKEAIFNCKQLAR